MQARRLRSRLTRYYSEEGQEDEIVIELPKGGYAPVIKRAEVVAPKRLVAATLVSRNTVVVLPFADHRGWRKSKPLAADEHGWTQMTKHGSIHF